MLFCLASLAVCVLHHHSRSLLQQTSELVAAATRPNSMDAGSSSGGLNNPSTNTVMTTFFIVLSSAFFLTGFLLIYLKRCSSSRQEEEAARVHAANLPQPSDVPPQGLDAAFLESLPLVTYSSSKKKGSHVECVVCLTDFNEGEPLCQLPRCKHVFHKECIDMWLYSHTTCPLCRFSMLSNGSRSFRWGGSGSFRLALQRSRRESGGGSTAGEGHASLIQRDANANMELGRIALTGARLFPRSHSTGYLLAVKKGESSMLSSVGTDYNNSGDMEPRTECSLLTPAVGFRRSRSMVAVREDAPAPVSLSVWMREARASLRRVLSVKKVSPAAGDFGIPVGVAASSSAPSTFDRLSPVESTCHK